MTNKRNPILKNNESKIKNGAENEPIVLEEEADEPGNNDELIILDKEAEDPAHVNKNTNIKQEMETNYGPRNEQHNLQPRRQHNYVTCTIHLKVR